MTMCGELERLTHPSRPTEFFNRIAALLPLTVSN
jgi:hypothetical protein